VRQFVSNPVLDRQPIGEDWERAELLHSEHAVVVQWYTAAGRLAQSYSNLAGKV